MIRPFLLDTWSLKNLTKCKEVRKGSDQANSALHSVHCLSMLGSPSDLNVQNFGKNFIPIIYKKDRSYHYFPLFIPSTEEYKRTKRRSRR